MDKNLDPEDDDEIEVEAEEDDEDASGEGDDAEPDDGDEEDDDEAQDAEGSEEGPRGRDGEQNRPLSRASRTVLKAKAERKEAQARLQQQERELAELRAQVSQFRQPQGESPEQEAARLSLMTPEEQVNHRLDKIQRTQAQQQAALARQARDMQDRQSFLDLAARDTLAARYAPKVEQRLVELRSKGQDISREILLKYIIGETIMAKKSGAISETKKKAKANIRRETVKPAASRSDQQTSRRETSEKAARNKRLENMTF